jgi:hypothetical protein
MQGRSAGMGRQRLEETEKTARAQGFELIARKAGDLLRIGLTKN